MDNLKIMSLLFLNVTISSRVIFVSSSSKLVAHALSAYNILPWSKMYCNFLWDA